MKYWLKFRNIFLYFILLSFVFMVLSKKSFPYTYWQCEGEPLTYRSGWTNLFLDGTLGSDSQSYNLRAQWAMSEWNGVTNSNWNFFYATEDHDFTLGDGYNSVAGLVSSAIPSGFIAWTWNQWDTCWKWGDQQNTESDVGFNSGNTWTTGPPPLDASGDFDLMMVAMHEFGHAIGLSQQSGSFAGDNHENRVLTTMNSQYPDGAWFGDSQWRTVHGDDRLGLNFLHPSSDSSREIAISQWQTAGAGSASRVGCSFLTKVGGKPNVSFTMENLGTVKENFNVGFYLSTNNIISTSDKLIGTASGWMDPGFSGTFTVSVTLPSSVTAGSYWLGTYLDYDSKLSERWEFNNAVSCPASTLVIP